MSEVRILGLGPVLACGQGRDALLQALRKGAGPLGADVSTESLTDFLPAPRIRRIDPLGRMALLAAYLALRDAGLNLEEVKGERTGIVVGSSFGPQSSTFSYLDGMIEAGDHLVSSVAFTNSVHNLAAAQVSLALGIVGPVRTVTAFGDTAGNAFRTAWSWIRSGRVDRVILILGEEASPVMTYAVRSMGGEAERVKPFAEGCSYAARPGCMGMVLGKEGPGYARLIDLAEGLAPGEAAERASRADALFCAAAGRADEFPVYRELWAKSRWPTAHSSLYGSLAAGLGVESAIAALALREGTAFSLPSSEGYPGPAAPPSAIRTAAVAGVSGPDRVTVITMES